MTRRSMKLLPLFTLVLTGLLALGTATTALGDDNGSGKQKVVYHVNYYGPKEQTAALRNVQNHINAVGAENLDLRVVLHGNGVAMLMYPDSLEGTKMKEANANDEMQARIAGLKQQGVRFEVCANTLKGRDVPMDALYDTDQADIVPSDVAELAKLQGQGFAYIKP